MRTVTAVYGEMGKRAAGAPSPLDRPAHNEILEAMLNEVLASELVCVLRHRRYQFMTRDAMAGTAARLLAHAQVAQHHADRVAERILELGGSPRLDPNELGLRSYPRDATRHSLSGMIAEDLQFLRTTMSSFTHMIRYVETADSATARMLTSLVAAQSEHARELGSLLDTLRA